LLAGELQSVTPQSGLADAGVALDRNEARSPPRLVEERLQLADLATSPDEPIERHGRFGGVWPDRSHDSIISLTRAVIVDEVE
jgi:hypothetical protein